MSWVALTIGCAAVTAAAGLIVWGVRYASRRGKKEGAANERAQALKASAERRARADAIAAQPLPFGRNVRAAWERYRQRRLRDLEGG